MRGRWKQQPFYDYQTKKHLITLELDDMPSIYESTKDKELNIEIKELRAKRSLNANAYFHVLVGKIADQIRASHTEVHNRMIASYGQVDSEMDYLIIKNDIPWEKIETIHLRPTTATKVLDDDCLYRCYQVMRGSHTYDTREMSILIDGVVSEAKELGIETLSPNELERMKQQWEGNIKA